ncbi:hypothetical protein CPB84DRAFT_1777097 [Gymnopilus junonius]|uniref:Uncharacterized protein n=1 Tax=Gymnopilus junonius TaxID=109634 RepID=A0A9P5NQD4_GYMJU|nr:hypothetical protein CPB84DRAFT_1777097 [Gymnopilus junonius]
MQVLSLARSIGVFSRRPATAAPFSSIQNAADSSGVPLKPTWSVNQLLSSYTSPKLSSTTINRLYDLSALTPPQEQAQYQALKRELGELIKLVEAVRLVDTAGTEVAGRGELGDADRRSLEVIDTKEYGQQLLRNAARTKDQFYVVDSERRR